MPAWFLAPHGQPFLSVEPVYALMIHLPAFSLKQDMYTLITITHPGHCQITYPYPESSLLIFSAVVLISGSAKMKHITCPPCTYLVTHLQYFNLFSLLSRLKGFFRSTSCSICLSRLKSATSCLS